MNAFVLDNNVSCPHQFGMFSYATYLMIYCLIVQRGEPIFWEIALYKPSFYYYYYYREQQRLTLTINYVTRSTNSIVSASLLARSVLCDTRAG